MFELKTISLYHSSVTARGNQAKPTWNQLQVVARPSNIWPEWKPAWDRLTQSDHMKLLGAGIQPAWPLRTPSLHHTTNKSVPLEIDMKAKSSVNDLFLKSNNTHVHWWCEASQCINQCTLGHLKWTSHNYDDKLYSYKHAMNSSLHWDNGLPQGYSIQQKLKVKNT